MTAGLLEAAADQLVAQGRLKEEVVRDAKARSSKALYDQSIAGLANATAENERSFGFLPDSNRKGTSASTPWKNPPSSTV